MFVINYNNEGELAFPEVNAFVAMSTGWRN